MMDTQEYINSQTNVNIMCKIHNTEFLQNPYVHLNGGNCHRCTGNHIPTTAEWIERAKYVHGDSYDYTNVIYTTSKTHVHIICKIHKMEFRQTPSGHLSGAGCPKCSKVYRRTNDEWIDSAKNIHGDLYDYSKTKYVNSRTKVIIICREHGEFEQVAMTHLSHHGCSKCSKNKRPTTTEYIENAKQKHGDKYDYSNVNYTTSTSKIIIGCPIHGNFEQSASTHLTCGCPRCVGLHRLTTIEFIENAIALHGDIYDYSKTKYKNNTTD